MHSQSTHGSPTISRNSKKERRVNRILNIIIISLLLANNVYNNIRLDKCTKIKTFEGLPIYRVLVSPWTCEATMHTNGLKLFNTNWLPVVFGMVLTD